jgi:hypothetical protein
MVYYLEDVGMITTVWEPRCVVVKEGSGIAMTKRPGV